MTCPKCGYLGFEQVDRCRNCGYDFSLAPDTPLPDLTIRTSDEDAGHPLDDLALTGVEAMSGPSDGQPASGSLAPASSALPLFGADDAPLITRPSPPRQPLAVRRATPDAARPRLAPRTPLLDLSGMTPVGGHIPSPSSVHDGWRSEPDDPQPAGVAARATAAAIDLAILAAIDVVVVYFTVQICGLTWADLGVLPKAPLVAFLLVQNGGYLVAFNAGGQTIGKMAAGIRVVPTGERTSIDVAQAFLRTAVWMVLAVPAGLGFATALLSRERRGLHDQFAGTRVVRATPSV
jgi:uncharacterized RDD family membrane protein YckC